MVNHPLLIKSAIMQGLVKPKLSKKKKKGTQQRTASKYILQNNIKLIYHNDIKYILCTHMQWRT